MPTRLAALILAGYCLVTALLWKQFWRRPDFRLKGRSEARDVFWDFLKNLALAGGFCRQKFVVRRLLFGLMLHWSTCTSSGVASPASRVRDFHEVLLKAVRDVTGAEVPFIRWNTTGPVN
ncbi:hypothetical protein LB559_14805 [Mesorhizobium sp. BR1-1-3]|uniref:hypothetical protein n=1 Tax=unclassified Mesorhizobium TaxID=325217 RepID=UPI0007ED7321|nr:MULTISPECIES: hypothetical protein [unclassified Mesorhizobium]MBZ9889209.1 hypothetical protein [Mesorhizobium sp. BR1-1-3]